ncbi:MAG: hypothetical protein KGN84_07800 [Acidobacteriota bacterium]|nr:hypothetical protein [Acidobacteriota bacterium]
MKRTLTLIALLAGALLMVFAQRPPWIDQASPAAGRTPYEVLSVFPRESSPGEYAQVEQRELRSLAADGWELVGVTPYVYRNEEHRNGEMRGPKPVVTQTYPAYFFKRMRLAR